MAQMPVLKTPKDLLAIDPGNSASGWVTFRTCAGGPGLEVTGFGKTENRQLRKWLRQVPKRVRGLLVIEMLRARGMPTANQEFLTCVEIGRFIQLWGPVWSFAFRGEIKLHLCGSPRAKDPNVRQALIDMFGGKEKAIGGKKCDCCGGKGWSGRGRPTCPACQGRKWKHPPGPLYKMAVDAWAALAIAIWWVQAGDVYHHIPAPKTKKRKQA